MWPKLDHNKFYSTYNGHTIRNLSIVYGSFREKNPKQTFVYLAGDSSLDNKYWIHSEKVHALNGYEEILNPPHMKKDVCYHINRFIGYKQDICAINCAVEASTLAERKDKLLPQDNFIRTYIQPNDVLVVSVGGNDIALRPSMKTIWYMFLLTCNSTDTILKNPENAWGINYFINMFRKDVKNYLKKLTSKNKPSKIIVCAIYYPDEKTTGSWADRLLGYIGYNTNPEKLQAAIDQIFIYAISRIKIPGVQVIPFPMFRILDGKTTEDYVQRVEPSDQGGHKLAQALAPIILD